MSVSIIVCHTKDRVIGIDGKMPWHLPRDLKRFKQITLQHPVVMGRKTFESLPLAPLPQRQNIVLSRNGFNADGCTTVCSLNEIKAITENYFIIGGEQIYKLFLPWASRIYRTILDTSDKEGDTFFPEIDEDEWKIVEEPESYPADQDNLYTMRFEVLERLQPHST